MLPKARALFRHVTPDTFVALSLFSGCSLVLGEAYCRTELSDAEAANDCSYAPTNRLVTSVHVRALERDGVVVIPNALTRRGLRNAREDVLKYASSKSSSASVFESADVGGEASADGESHATGSIRQDLVCWLRPNRSSATNSDSADDGVDEVNEEENPANGPSLEHCIDLVRGVASALTDLNYTDSHSHRVPLQCQLALYKGDGRSGYARHLDRCDATLGELGLLEYLRLSDFRGRAVTVILYLNDTSRTKEDGGQLRCWLRKDDHAQRRAETDEKDPPAEIEKFWPAFDIQPTGGSMLIFDSDRLEHQVLASVKDRYALTVWINGSHRSK
mmetsp:Transcript_17980/g.51493  ORF Transcript_17980/g.51493 Transcript_17980/m.51493 type:complete len:332 (+) Transcript_17980:137-1132(+)|eukprot:CAMPEP_0181032826 /NCGR_PEP_ID=MMETSP1070-20121207/6937_1 /TAXON_ID=265543 /ORGANISM="Minutocellus polymorphus, Strain NH13" /LENGTH=331 /DNA_ID=CAMNT_0023110225 /DNA_START=99 /DNA_END=1094 /DNA_ORIENTATION=-